MPYETFWHGDPWAAKHYREADRASLMRADYLAWLQGRYVYDAICEVAPILRALSKAKRPSPYTEMPYMQRSEQEERQRAQARQLENGEMAAKDIARWLDRWEKANEAEA